MRSRTTSLQTRLAAWLIGSAIVLFGLYWVMTSSAPRRFTENYALQRLEHDAENLLVALRFDPNGTPSLNPNYDRATYTRPYSGHYFVVQSGAHRIRSRSLWDTDLATLAPGRGVAGINHQPGPQHQSLLVWSRVVQKHGYRATITVAEDLSRLEHELNRFRLRFAALSIIVLGVLILAQRLIVRRSLRPLEALREDFRKLHDGRIQALREDVPVEIQPLVRELNRLLTLNQQRMQRSRTALGNLAHALKTPLTRLTHAARDAPEALEPELSSATRQIREIIDRELKRARLAGEALPGRQFDVCAELYQLAGIIQKIHPDKTLSFIWDLPEHATYAGDREDMLELFGNLLDNAAKWAKQRIGVSVTHDGVLRVCIEDDGPGVDDDQLVRLAQRGVRLDEATPGHGLGLSIVNEIVEQYGGRLGFSTAQTLGGLRVEIALPEPTHGVGAPS